jgi:hypothetical protein
MHLLDILTILCTVTMVGTEFTVAVILNPALEKLDQTTWMKTMPVLAQAMGRAMPFWYALGLILIGTEGYLHWGAPSRWWLGASVLLWAAGIVYSVTMLVPINNRIATVGTARASSTVAEHKR